MKTSILLALLTSVALSAPVQAQTKRLSDHATAKSRNQGHSESGQGSGASKPSSSVSGGKADGDRIHIKDKSTFMNVDFAHQNGQGSKQSSQLPRAHLPIISQSSNPIKSHITIVSQKQDAESKHTTWESAHKELNKDESVRMHDTEWSKHGHTITTSSKDLEDKSKGAHVHDKYMSMGSPGPTFPDPEMKRMHTTRTSSGTTHDQIVSFGNPGPFPKQSHMHFKEWSDEGHATATSRDETNMAVRMHYKEWSDEGHATPTSWKDDDEHVVDSDCDGTNGPVGKPRHKRKTSIYIHRRRDSKGCPFDWRKNKKAAPGTILESVKKDGKDGK